MKGIDSVNKVHFRKVHGILLVYDVTDRKTFDNLTKWIHNLKKVLHNYMIWMGYFYLWSGGLSFKSTHCVARQQGRLRSSAKSWYQRSSWGTINCYHRYNVSGNIFYWQVCCKTWLAIFRNQLPHITECDRGELDVYQ